MTRAEETPRSGVGPHLRLTLDLRLEADPVAGVLRDGAAEEPFFGWSGLTRAIELALQAHRPGDGGTIAGRDGR